MAALYFDATGLAYSFDDGHIAVRTVHSVKHVPTHQSSITQHGKVALSVKYVAADLSSITTIPSGTDCQICHELRHPLGHNGPAVTTKVAAGFFYSVLPQGLRSPP